MEPSLSTMRITIHMNSTKNMLINEAILGYVPSERDPNRVIDHTYNLQIHLPRIYKREDAERCVYALRDLLLNTFTEFDYKSVKLVRHKSQNGAYFHHVSTEEVREICPLDEPIKLAFTVYAKHIVGQIKCTTKYGLGNPVTPEEVFVTNKDSKPIKG